MIGFDSRNYHTLELWRARWIFVSGASGAFPSTRARFGASGACGALWDGSPPPYRRIAQDPLGDNSIIWPGGMLGRTMMRMRMMMDDRF